MSEDPTTDANHHGKHWVGWTLALVAVPVMYLLAVPPVGYGVMTNWGTTGYVEPPPWMDRMVFPYRWTLQNTFLEKPLTLYANWWETTWGFRIAHP